MPLFCFEEKMSIYKVIPKGDPLPISINQVMWVKNWGKNKDGADDFVLLPLRVIRILEDGTWEGELSEGYA